MRNLRLVMAAVVSCLLALPALAADAPPGTLAQIFVQKLKPGAQAQYEGGRKKHMDWHRKQADAWEWSTWEILTGPRTGEFLVGSFGHHWKDFDGRGAFEEKDAADAVANMGASEESSTMAFFDYQPNLSLPGEGPLPAAMSQVAHYFVTLEGLIDFQDAIKKANAAIKKSHYPSHPMWYRLTSGGEGPHFVGVQVRKTWAEFEPPEKTLQDMLTEVYGKIEGPATLAKFRKQIRYVETEILRYRPDLSYVPGK